MGNLLGSPITTKETHAGTTTEGNRYAVSSMQGWRVHMEDAHIAEPRLYAVDEDEQRISLPDHGLFAVFDGHGGTFAAKYAGQNLCRVLSCQPKFVEYARFENERPEKEKTFTKSDERSLYIQSGLTLLKDALTDAFITLDQEIARALKGSKVPQADQPYHEDSEPVTAHASATNDTTVSQDGGGEALSPEEAALQLLQEEGDSGTTACVVMVTPEWVVCANAGDSRAVMSKLGNRVVPLSYDHKPDAEEEEQRIRAAGGFVAGGRVEGDLAVSRGLGDFRFKNMEVVMAAVTSSSAAPLEDDEDPLPLDQPFVNSSGEHKVSPIPDIIVQNRNASQDEYIIVACDGIWDVQTNYEGIKTVADLFQEGESDIGLICEEVGAVVLILYPFFCPRLPFHLTAYLSGWFGSYLTLVFKWAVRIT